MSWVLIVKNYLAAYSFVEDNSGLHPLLFHFFFKNKLKKNMHEPLIAQAFKMQKIIIRKQSFKLKVGL